MPPTTRPRGRPKGNRDTAALLIQAAMGEFCEAGYNATDTNKIARRAGFAPQTFYRWFSDKTEIFIAAYHAWVEEEQDVLGRLISRQATTEQIAAAIIRQHKNYRVFRRSLRLLAVEDPLVRAARTASRRQQAQNLCHWRGLPDDAMQGMLIRLLQIERLADAAAEDEGDDLSIPESALRQAICELIEADS